MPNLAEEDLSRETFENVRVRGEIVVIVVELLAVLNEMWPGIMPESAREVSQGSRSRSPREGRVQQ